MSRLLWLVPLLCLTGGHAVSAEVPLIEAVKAADEAAVRTLLTGRVDVNTPGADGTTALHWAVEGDHPELVELLLRAGVTGFVPEFLGENRKIGEAPRLVAIVVRLRVDLLDQVSAALTTEELTDLNRRFDVDKDDAEDIAADFLSAEGLK